MSLYSYQEGDLFIGQDGDELIGLTTERHAITIAGAGAGKGASVIIPNLLKWKSNALVIDPKGEAVDATAQARVDMGQSVHVLDPFDCCPKWKNKATINPLDAIDEKSATAREDINVLADGIVMRSKDDGAAHWDIGARDLIAGVIAYVCLTQDKEWRNLDTVRNIISDKNLLDRTMEKAKDMHGCGNLPQSGASAYLAQEGGYFLSNADKNTKWLDSPAMQTMMQKSSFAMSDLKNKNATVYLVLPANYLVEHGRFLRLFVRSAIEAMQKRTPKGELRDKQCLFLLDEFFALGYISEIATSAGLMRGYGLQLWPILQDYGQLTELYGQEGAQTFFGNADLHQFFGNTDINTLEYMSRATGLVGQDEVGNAPNAPTQSHNSGIAQGLTGGAKSGMVRGIGAVVGGISQSQDADYNSAVQAEHQDRMNAYQQRQGRVGRPRYAPDELAKMVERKTDKVADKMLCIFHGTDVRFITPAPFFRKTVSEKVQDVDVNGRTVNARVEQIIRQREANNDFPFTFGQPICTITAFLIFSGVMFWLSSDLQGSVILGAVGTIVAFFLMKLYNKNVTDKVGQQAINQACSELRINRATYEKL